MSDVPPTHTDDAPSPMTIAPDEPTVVVLPPSSRRKRRNSVIEWVVVIVVAVAAALLVKTFLLQQFQVSGHSMDTTLHHGDRVLVNKLSYRLHDPNRGDVVVLETLEGSSERDLIKRVIALPGEEIDIRNCHVYIDGKELIEPYLDVDVAPCTEQDPSSDIQFPYTVPDEEVFVLGDNRPGSMDSRRIGSIEYDHLLGRAFVIIWPVGDWAWL
ncbi:MAG TPA: signal peptidase I [Ilumatobacteraceae bacterium]|nr:signal peptidase I [Ilumatobacteraceae bacterium]